MFHSADHLLLATQCQRIREGDDRMRSSTFENIYQILVDLFAIKILLLFFFFSIYEYWQEIVVQ